ncbi:hypothetical protein EUTSA_v10027592mg [Eutrema salsugineum]|uniref:Uncharacterized protein n=1 Tax=Eutrema salsugineum TaxID=72664 RepID=V4P1D7_EUTSA|nr:hypothetical protein EUTSA_v10027592mg [Eutrema salsugineum]
MVTDNEKGLVLAVASSVFVGSSFILKKKGLKRAAANGTRAGSFPPYPLFTIILLLDVDHLFCSFFFCFLFAFC